MAHILRYLEIDTRLDKTSFHKRVISIVFSWSKSYNLVEGVSGGSKFGKENWVHDQGLGPSNVKLKKLVEYFIYALKKPERTY